MSLSFALRANSVLLSPDDIFMRRTEPGGDIKKRKRLLPLFSSENDQHAHQNTGDGGKGGKLAVIH